MSDLDNDAEVGFEIITTDDIDEIGTSGIIQLIRKRVGNGPVYLSLDIDVIDPSLAPASVFFVSPDPQTVGALANKVTYVTWLKTLITVI